LCSSVDVCSCFLFTDQSSHSIQGIHFFVEIFKLLEIKHGFPYRKEIAKNKENLLQKNLKTIFDEKL